MKLTDSIPDFVHDSDTYNYIVAREAYYVSVNLFKDDCCNENHQRMLRKFAEWEATNQKPKIPQ